MVKVAIVHSSELAGGACMLPARFVEGARCHRAMACTYPYKSTCKAVGAELVWLDECEKVYAERLARGRRLLMQGLDEQRQELRAAKADNVTRPEASATKGESAQ